jgi:hypothetical protein
VAIGTTLFAAAALFVALAWPCLYGEIYLGDDLGAYHVPARAFYAKQLSSGEAFDWWPAIHGGYLLSAEGQAGLYHPCHLALYRWLKLNAALAVELIAPYPLAFLGAYLFLRRRLSGSAGCQFAALSGALFFTFSAFNLLHFVHTNAVAVFAHLPWLLWAEDRLLATKTVRERALPALVISLLTGSQLLLGYPQFVWFSLLAVLAFAVATIPPADRARSLARLSGALFLGLLIGGVQWLPTLDLLRHSTRERVTSAVLLEGSLHPWSFAELVGPYLFAKRVVGQNTHELACYFGAVPLVLVAWLLSNRQRVSRNARAFAWGWLLFAAAALALALGKYGVGSQLLTYLPVVGKFRFPSRYVGLATWGVSLAAAVALVALASFNRKRAARQNTSQPITRSPLVLVGVSVVIAVLAPWLWGVEHLGSAWEVAAGPLLIGAAALLVLAAERGFRAAPPALLLLAALDLGIYGFSYAPLRQTGSLEAFVAETIVPAGDSTSGRVVCDLPGAAKLTGNRLTLAGFERWDGYAGLAPLRLLDPRQLSTLRLAGVRWVARTAAAEQIVGLVPRDEHWLEVPDPLPKYRFVTDVVIDDNPIAALEHNDLRTCAVVDRLPNLSEGPWVYVEGDPLGRIGVRRAQAGAIDLVTSAPSRQLLVIAESYHTGWTAEVDGRPVEVIRTNGDFCGVVVPVGEHSLSFEFRPASLRWGRGVTLLGLLLTVQQYVAGRRATNRVVPPVPSQSQSTVAARGALPSID